MGSFMERKEWRQLMNKNRTVGRLFGRMIDPGSKEVLSKNEALQQFMKPTLIRMYLLTG